MQLQLGPYPVHLLKSDEPFSETTWQDQLPAAVQEQAATYKAKSRREEFLRSRYLLQQLGTPIVGTGDGGEPLWEDGVVASLTHKQGHVAVVQSRLDQTKGIGIDLESVAKVRLEFTHRICTESDRILLEKFPATEQQQILTTIFAAKEALYKCHFPLGAKQFYFQDAELDYFEANKGQLGLKVLRDTSPVTPRGSVTHGFFRQLDLGGLPHILALMSL